MNLLGMNLPKKLLKKMIVLGCLVLAGEVNAGRLALVQCCPYSSVCPVIDGKITDKEWKDAVAISGFVYGTDAQIAPVQTLVYAKWSDKTLYLGFVAFEPKMDKLVVNDVGRDGRLWWNDNIEIFICPCTDNLHTDKRKYFHFIVDAKGRQYDGIGRSASWNGKWQSMTCLSKDRWTLEIAIPFSTLGREPIAGGIWRINYTRTRLEKGVNDDSWASQWSSSAGDYHRPELFGYLYFSRDKCKFSASELQKVFHRIFSYPGPIVRVFVKEGYFDVTYAGVSGFNRYKDSDRGLSDRLQKWISKLQALAKDKIDKKDKESIKNALLQYKGAMLSGVANADKRLAVMQWVYRRIVSEREISKLSDLYWKIKLKSIRKELVR